MNARRDKDRLIIRLNVFEARLLHHTLQVIVENYRVGPAALDTQTAGVWYSERGCRSAKMSDEETRDWLASLHQVKSGSLIRLKEWIAALAVPKPSGHSLRLELAGADTLLTALNDYRLMTAARQQITEADMDCRSEDALAAIPSARRKALMEIHLLAWLIEEILDGLGRE